MIKIALILGFQGGLNIPLSPPRLSQYICCEGLFYAENLRISPVCVRLFSLCSYNRNPSESGTIKQDLNNKKHDKNKHTNKRGRIELNKAGYNPQKISLTILGNILKGVL